MTGLIGLVFLLTIATPPTASATERSPADARRNGRDHRKTRHLAL